MPKHPNDYQPEIDGLRALAVLAVVLFHAGLGPFRGGYTGVDVFFVISGYLITRLIHLDLREDRFSLVTFYERRARRILPALFFVMALCLPAAWLWLGPAQLKNFGQSLVAVSLFASNVLFWLRSGYFDAAAEERPLLHTWSLGVEEQFYVVFPLLLLALWRWRRKTIAPVLVAIALASLALAQWGGNLRPTAPFIDAQWLWTAVPDWAFYLAPARAWELLLGALLAIGRGPERGRTLPPALQQTLSLAGLALVLGATMLLDEHTPFPSFYALAPVLGSALLIAFAAPDTLAGRLLASKPMVGVGLLSYSAYLWHQPLFAFARAIAQDKPAPWVFGLLAVASFALAWPTWRFIEQPWRTRGVFSRRTVFAAAAAGSTFFIAVGIAAHLSGGLDSRYSGPERTAINPPHASVGECREPLLAQASPLTWCRLGAPSVTPTLVLYGDSHADAISGAFGAALAAQGRAAMLVKNSACEVIPSIYREPNLRSRHVALCEQANRQLLARLALPDVTGIVVLARWTTALYPAGNLIDAPHFDNGIGGVENDLTYRENLALDTAGGFSRAAPDKLRAVSNLVQGFAATGKPVVLVYPVPEVGWNVPSLNFKAHALGRPMQGSISTGYDRFLSRNAFALQALDAVKAPNLMRVRPSELLCNTFVPGRCAAQVGGQPLYYDDDHLNTRGAQMVVEQIMRLLPP